MSVTRREFLVLLSAIGLSTARGHASSRGLAVITNLDTGILRLSDVELESIFLTERHYWSGTKPIVPFNLMAHSEERVEFDRVVLRMDPDAVARFWRDRRVRSGSPPPRQISDPLTVLRVVAKLGGAIGYVPESIVTRDVHVVARIRNGKVQIP
jgi:hypothetical protein